MQALLCIGALACSTGPTKSPPGGQRSGWVPIEEARGIVVEDAARQARAFRNGAVGRPRPSVKAARALSTSLPVPAPSLGLAALSPDAIRLDITCGTAREVVRTSPTFAWLASCTSGQLDDGGLEPGTTYCYELRSDAGPVAEACTRTLYRPYVFAGPGLTQAESDQMAASFDWTHTDPVAAEIATPDGPKPALYSMNILVRTVGDLQGLRGLGIHTQTEPLFQDEQDAWDGKVMQAMANGEPRGVWITAIVPGPVYNDLRDQAIAGIANGAPIGIDAMVFRKINLTGAAFYDDPTLLVNPINPTFLGEQGIAYNGYSAIQCWVEDGVRYCQIEQALIGWLVNKAITLVVEVYEAVMDTVHTVLGDVARLIFGEVDLTVQLVLKNSDEEFDTSELARSGWKDGAPLVLKNLRLRVYQGVAQFGAITDANGVATVTVAKNVGGKVCIELENDLVEIVDTFTEREICFQQRFSGMTAPTTITLETNNKYANVLAAITDAAEYLETVMGVQMNKVSVLTGWQSALLTSLNNGRSFAPCMGRLPNLAANIGAYADTVVSPTLSLLAEVGEFLNAYDIVLAPEDSASRGTSVHEYGHAVMCQLMREASQVKASLAWADVIVATMGGQSPLSQQSMVAEGFADFLALQVVGGAAYFNPINGKVGHMTYCQGDSLTAAECAEYNEMRCTTQTWCTYETNTYYVASLLQDVFDRVPADLAERADPSILLPNDGSHWRFDGTRLLPHRASNQISSRDEDVIELAGPKLATIFSKWAARGDLLRYDSFLGGVAVVLKDEGYDVTAVCAMFGAHETNGHCPQYVIDVFGGPPPPGNPPPVGGDRFAYALADQPDAKSYEPDAAYAHSDANTTIRIGHNQTLPGRYRVTFNDLPPGGAGLSASVAVTAFGSSTITCSAGSLLAVGGGNGTQVDVVCWDHAANDFANSRFSILFIGNDGMPYPSAFLGSGGSLPLPPLDPALSWTSGRYQQTVTPGVGPGSYLVNLGVGNALMSAKLVTAKETAGGERCNIRQLISGGIEAACFDRTGAPADRRFNVVQLATGKPGRRFGVALANNATAGSYVPLADTSYNSSGGAITISRSAVGHYLVDFTGLRREVGHTENVQVTALAPGLATCNAATWSSSPTGLQVAVECSRGASFVDSRYEVVVVE